MDNDDYSSDVGPIKRKGIEELFVRSAKVKITPIKQRSEENIDEIIEVITQLKKESKQIKIEQQSV